jgi:hypothetical protein
VPEVVSDAELPSAATLSGLQFNSVHHPLAKGSLLVRLSRLLGKFGACLGLRVYGVCSPG